MSAMLGSIKLLSAHPRRGICVGYSCLRTWARRITKNMEKEREAKNGKALNVLSAHLSDRCIVVLLFNHSSPCQHVQAKDFCLPGHVMSVTFSLLQAKHILVGYHCKVPIFCSPANQHHPMLTAPDASLQPHPIRRTP